MWGFLAFAALAWLVGGMRRDVSPRTVIGAAISMWAIAAIVFLAPPARAALLLVNEVVVRVLDASRAGAVFLGGPLALNPGETTEAGEASIGFVFAAQVLPAVVFFAAVMAAGYHLGWVQAIVRLFARVFRATLRLSGAEALVASANVFVGVESATTVRPYLARMTRSELLTLLTCAMSTVASTTLAVYVFVLRDGFPNIAGHLISASVVSIPAAVLISKLMMPEDGEPETLGELPPTRADDAPSTSAANVVGAIASGAGDGLKLAVGIATLLIAILGIVGVVDLLLAWVSAPFAEPIGGPLSLARLLGWVFYPLTWLLGVASDDLAAASRILGSRLIVTEVVAYRELGALASAGELAPRTVLIVSYALCGFAHVASMGIFVGGVAALAPSRRDDLAALGGYALVGSTLATLMTGALAGAFYHGQSGVLGI